MRGAWMSSGEDVRGGPSIGKSAEAYEGGSRDRSRSPQRRSTREYRKRSRSKDRKHDSKR